MTDMTKKRAQELLKWADPDWVVYAEPEVGLPPSLFSGKIGQSEFGPIEPLQGFNLNLAAAAPALARAYIATATALEAAQAENAALREGRDAYQKAYEDSKRLARLIDVAMHGDEGAAKQASLCDLVVPARQLRTERNTALSDLAAAREQIEALRGALDAVPIASKYGAGLAEYIRLCEDLYRWHGQKRAALASTAEEGR